MKKTTVVTLLIFFLLIPVTIFLGTKLPGRGYYITATAVILEMLLPFFMAFEGRRVQARELVVIAVLCAIAVVARIAIPIPHFKPMFAIIMLCGVAFGPQTGFMVGALSAFVSNFFAGQGAYTPWQMFAYGAGGLLAGFVLSHRSRSPWLLGGFGFCATMFLVGPLLDTSTVFLSMTHFSWEAVLTIYFSGFPVNLSNALCTALTMLLLAKPFLEKLERMQVKYGLLQ